MGRRAVTQDGDEEEAAVVRARDLVRLACDLRHQLVALRRRALLEDRLQHTRRIVLLQHRQHLAIKELEHLID